MGNKRGVSRKGKAVRTENKGAGMVDEVIRRRAGWGREMDSILSAVQSQGRVLAEERHNLDLDFEKAPSGCLERNGG